MTRFFWPGIHENVRRWRAACRECQLVHPLAYPKAPLRPLPLMQVPFERIGMDLTGPLEQLARGHRFALVLVNYATRYPEAVALRNISTAFMSQTVRELYESLDIKSIHTSVYHPQIDGLVERFNCTLKTMILKLFHEDAQKIGTNGWNPFCLLCVRSRKPPRGFLPSSSFMGSSPVGFWKKVVQSELEAMLEMGVVEESHSDWASPIVLVPKL